MYTDYSARKIPLFSPIMYIRKIKKSYHVEVQRGSTRKRATFKTKKEAQTWGSTTELALGKGEGSIPNISFGDLLDRYSREVSPTKRGHRWEVIRIKAFKKDLLAQVMLPVLTEKHVSEWRDWRLKAVSSGSVRREWTLLSSACTVALNEWKWLDNHPFKGVRLPPNPPARDRLISESEIENITYSLGYKKDKLCETTSARVGAIFLFAIETAMRAGEIVNLTWDRVDITSRIAHLDKTKTTKRDVPLSGEAVRILKQVKGTKFNTVFGVESGTLDALFRRAKTSLAIDNLHFHDTRHEAITRLAKKLNPLELARMVGHKNLNQLLTYYNATAKELAKKLG